MEGGVVIAFITASKGKGEEIAKRLLEDRVIACANVTNVRSFYWWKGRIENDEEDLIIVKTSMKNVERLIDKVKKYHEYEVPEVLILPVITCLRDYCDWVREETS